MMLSCTFVLRLEKNHISRFWPRQDTRAVKPISPFFGPSQTAFGSRGLDKLGGGDQDGKDDTGSQSWFIFFHGDVWVMFV